MEAAWKVCAAESPTYFRWLCWDPSRIFEFMDSCLTHVRLKLRYLSMQYLWLNRNDNKKKSMYSDVLILFSGSIFGSSVVSKAVSRAAQRGTAAACQNIHICKTKKFSRTLCCYWASRQEHKFSCLATAATTFFKSTIMLLSSNRSDKLKQLALTKICSSFSLVAIVAASVKKSAKKGASATWVQHILEHNDCL